MLFAEIGFEGCDLGQPAPVALGAGEPRSDEIPRQVHRELRSYDARSEA
jgi:hypothetical protein